MSKWHKLIFLDNLKLSKNKLFKDQCDSIFSAEKNVIGDIVNVQDSMIVWHVVEVEKEHIEIKEKEEEEKAR